MNPFDQDLGNKMTNQKQSGETGYFGNNFNNGSSFNNCNTNREHQNIPNGFNQQLEDQLSPNEVEKTLIDRPPSHRNDIGSAMSGISVARGESIVSAGGNSEDNK